MTHKEAAQRAKETKPLHTKLLQDKKKASMALVVLREEALSYLPKASLNEVLIQEIESILLEG
jgi:hypothetical protein